MAKFDILREKGTNGINCDIDTEDIIKKLKDWDSLYNIEISDVEHDGLFVKFETLPNDTKSFANEVYQFCPDIVEQHFGCMDEMVEIMEETGQELPGDVAELIQGVDMEDENFGMVLLEKSIKANRVISLWWD